MAFAGARHLQVMEKASGQKIERVIASGGGAKTELWLRIKASIYNVPIVVPHFGLWAWPSRAKRMRQ